MVEYRIYERQDDVVDFLTSVASTVHEHLMPAGAPPGFVEYSVTSVDADGNESVIAMWQVLQELPESPSLHPTSSG